MKVIILSLLISLGAALAEPPPLPQLVTFFDREERIFGLWWISAGASYRYHLEVNEDDGFGWFVAATWESPPKGAVMSGYTLIGDNAIGRVRVERVENPPKTPKGVINWKVLTPIRF